MASGLSVGSVHKILHNDLHLSKLQACWVLRLLSDEHKSNHVKMAWNFKRQYQSQGQAFFEKLVTMDETWVAYSTPELKKQSAQWLPKGSPAPTKAKAQPIVRKVMLIAFFDIHGMVYQHYTPRGQTINSVYYTEVLSTFLKHLAKKRPEKVVNSWLLHQDNVRPHVSAVTMDFMAKKGIEVLEHAPYSPDLAPCYFFFFPALKSDLAGRSFADEKELKIAVEGCSRQLAREGFWHVFERWNKRMTKCIELGGDYVEKMH